LTFPDISISPPCLSVLSFFDFWVLNCSSWAWLFIVAKNVFAKFGSGPIVNNPIWNDEFLASAFSL